MKVEFAVVGEPVGKGRPRFTNQGHTYTPEKTVIYENLVKLSYTQKYKHISFDGGTPIAVSIIANLRIPKNTSKRKADLIHRGMVFPTKKPDCDNIAKIICDALNGVAYPDDKQIVSLYVTKKYSDEPKVEVSIWDIPEAKF